MNLRISKISVYVVAFVWLTFCFGIVQGEDGHNDGEDHEEESGALVMTAAELSAAGVIIGPVERASVSEQLRLPGEVVPNAYTSAKVAPRITAQVVRRHARLGDAITENQPLVTLSSVEMADAQGELLVADQEWQRVKALGPEVLSGRRYTEAQVGRQRALAKVLAYGMNERQANELLKKGEATLANGEFDLLAPLAGTVIADEFLIGELIEPGRVMFEISDESTLWVEARISAGKLAGISSDDPVKISANKVDWHDAKVVQVHHRLDEVTRTQAVRIELDNKNDLFHAGQFVEVKMAVGEKQNLLAIPGEAAVLLKGDTVVFLAEENDEFHPQPVILGNTFGEDREVLSGLKEGDVIVISGAYFLKSLILKSEMGEGHAH